MIPNNPKLEDLVTRKKIERKYKEHVFIELRKQNRQKIQKKLELQRKRFQNI